jgi:hypothetical protein
MKFELSWRLAPTKRRVTLWYCPYSDVLLPTHDLWAEQELLKCPDGEVICRIGYFYEPIPEEVSVETRNRWGKEL